MSMENYDVVIVGAGIGGLAFVLLLLVGERCAS